MFECGAHAVYYTATRRPAALCCSEVTPFDLSLVAGDLAYATVHPPGNEWQGARAAASLCVSPARAINPPPPLAQACGTRGAGRTSPSPPPRPG